MLQNAGFVSTCQPFEMLMALKGLPDLPAKGPRLRPQSVISQLHHHIVSAAAPRLCAAETLVNAWELQLVSEEGGQPDRAGEACCGPQVSAAPAPEVPACNSAALHQNGPGSIQRHTPAPEVQQVPFSAGLAVRSALLWRLSS